MAAFDQREQHVGNQLNLYEEEIKHLREINTELLTALKALRDELKEGGKTPDLATIHAFIIPKVDEVITKAEIIT